VNDVPATPPRVLLVDDDLDTREMYSWSLSARGFDVICAASGVNALAEAGADQPDIVVTDFTLPGMTGVELATRLKEVPATACPVVLVSGREFSGVARAEVLKVCDSILLKPVLPDRLAEEIRHVLIVTTARRLRQQMREMRARIREAVRTTKTGQEAAAAIVATVEELQADMRCRAAVLVADDQAHYIAVNHAACEVTGLSEEQLLTRSVWDITPGMDVPDGQRMWREFIERGALEGTYTVGAKGVAPVNAWFSAEANVAPHLHVSLLAPVPADAQDGRDAEA
jgi:CheY-like chemotaxis protein